MKKFFIIIILVAGAFHACDFLEEEPLDFLAPANFYQSESDAIAAVDAIYGALGYYGNMWRLGDLASELLDEGAAPRPEHLELQTYTFSSDNNHFANFWRDVYVSINRANIAIEWIPDIDMNPDVRERLIAEAKFLRALNYFDLVKVFGGVPIITSDTKDLQDLEIEKSLADEVYMQIIQDLEESQPVLPLTYGNADIGRATKGAAGALLAKVYLFNGNFEQSAEKAREVMQMNYSLVENYADIWPSNNENGPEHIFSIQYKAGIRGSGFNNTFGVRGGREPITGGSEAFVRKDFYESFEDGDIRKAVSVRTSYTFDDGSTANFEPHVWKFFNPFGITPSNTDTNWPVIRYSEVLLILAEAANELNNGPNSEAYDAIDQVRNRAQLADLPLGLDRDGFLDAVIQERAWELCFEGHRRFDLIRSGKLAEIMETKGIAVEIPKHNVFPLPLRELDVNKNLEQNPGYN